MPSFDFFATFEESIAITSDLVPHGFKVVPEADLPREPKANVFEAVTPDLVEMLRRGPSHYLMGAFTRFPIQFHAVKDGTYVIDLLEQGPLIQALLGRTNVVNGQLRLLAGSYSHQRQYRNPDTKIWENASPEIKAAYRQVVTVVKQHCKPHMYKPNIKIFIAPKALEMLQSGEATIIENQIVPGGAA